MFEKRSQRNINLARKRRKEAIAQKIEKLPKLNKKKIFSLAVSAVAVLNFSMDSGKAAFASENISSTNSINQLEQLSNQKSQEFQHNTTTVENLSRPSETIQPEINQNNSVIGIDELENNFDEPLDLNINPTEIETPTNSKDDLITVDELETDNTIHVYPSKIEKIDAKTPVTQEDINGDVLAFLENKESQLDKSLTANTYQDSIEITDIESISQAEVIPEVKKAIDLESNIPQKVKERLGKIKSHESLGYKNRDSFKNEIPDPELGSIVSSSDLINQSENVEIIDNGSENPTIKTTTRTTELGESTINHKTEYEINQPSSTDFLTFEITGLRKNSKTGQYENIIGAQSGKIEKNGSFNPKKTTNKRAKFFKKSTPEPVSQKNVDTFLKPGITSRADLFGISRNITAPITTQIDEENISYSREDYKKNRQKISINETSRTTKGDKNKTTITRKDISINLVEDNQQNQALNKKYIKANKPVRKFNPDFEKDGKTFKKLKQIAKKSQKDNSVKQWQKFQNEQSKSTQPNTGIQPISFNYSKNIDNQTLLHRQKLLQKLSNLAHTSVQKPTIGYRQSTVTTKRGSLTGKFTGFDFGLQQNRDIKTTTSLNKSTKNVQNVFRVGVENDNVDTTAIINGKKITDNSFLFGIIAGYDRENFQTKSTLTRQYFDRNNITAGVSAGIAKKDKYISGRLSINHDLFDNKLYPRITLNGGINNGKYGVSSSMNLSTNPTYSNPNQIIINGYKNIRNKSRNIAQIYSNLKFGIGSNHDLFRDKSTFGIKVQPSKRLVIDLSHSPKITNNSISESSANVSWVQKWGQIFGGVTKRKSSTTIGGGVKINTSKNSHLKLNLQHTSDTFRNENVGTIQFVKGL